MRVCLCSYTSSRLSKVSSQITLVRCEASWGEPERLSLKRGTGNRGMGTGNLRGMTGESAGNLFLGIIEQ